MRFGISATSLMCPKNLRTRLRPVNVCCAIVASHFVALKGRTFRSAIGIAPGLNLIVPNREPRFWDQSPESQHRTFKPQNDARARCRTRSSKPASSRTEKARNCLSPNGLRGNAAVPFANRAFVLPSRYGMAIVEIRGVTLRIPTQSCVQPGPDGTRPGRRRLLQFDLRAGLLELGLDLVGLVLVDAFLDRLGRALDEILGLLEAEAGDGPDFLDDFDLLFAGGGKHHREFGLLFNGSSGSAATGRAGHRHRGCGGYAPLLFEQLGEFGRFEHGEAREVVDDFL